MPTKLSRRTLGELAGKAVVPTYDPAQLRAGIMHFGVGNFHRAHQAVYLDDLFSRGLDHGWAEVGAGVRATDEIMRERLAAQDYLTTVVEQEATSSSARIVGSLIDYLPIGETRAIISRLSDPAIRIVSLTITEGGYYIDPATNRANPTHPDIVRDAERPASPKTVFGFILAGLAARRRAGIEPFTVMSCDNVPGNGQVTRAAVVGLAQLSDDKLAEWVASTVAFPNSMVDRITPATSDRERELLAAEFGIDDNCPVFCESFRQWVVEDHFPSGRPALEEVGVQFVQDVSPFEHMKIRILNGGHAIIAYPAALMGIHFVHEAMHHPLLRGFLEKVERDEILPIVPPAPSINPSDYFALIGRRFSNPKIGDTIPRLCFDGSNRQPKFILPSIRARLAAGGSVGGLALVSALWCRYCMGSSDSGRRIEPSDPQWTRLSATADLARLHPSAWLEMEDIYGNLRQSGEFSGAFSRQLASVMELGVKGALERYLSSSL